MNFGNNFLTVPLVLVKGREVLGLQSCSVLTILQCTIRIRKYFNCYAWNCSMMPQVLLNSGCCICLLISENNYLISPKGSG